MVHLNFNDPFFIGFERLIDRISETETRKVPRDNYPPFNILKKAEDHFIIEMAVAGLNEEDLSITVKDGTLLVEANPKSKDEEREWLHHGIATRSFSRQFNLADTIEVRNAALINGILSIELVNVIPEEKKPRKVEIGKQLLLEQ